MADMSCFKAYDIRGRVPEDLDPEIARRIGRAYARLIVPKTVAVGRDVRLSSPGIAEGLITGLLEEGCDVVDLGLCGTEEVYFAVFHGELDGGIMVTASHNPGNYNGMKLVRRGARPISGDSGLNEIRDLAATGDFPATPARGRLREGADKQAYVRHLLGYLDPVVEPRPLKIVANAGHGCAGPVLEELARHLPCRWVRLGFEPDGTFPEGIPNPLLPKNRDSTRQAVLEHGADLGLAWDGDFDRCFFFDEQGRFIEGYYLVGLLAEFFLERHPGGKVIHDPRLCWNTVEVVTRAGGVPVRSKTGHAFIKERMRAEDAVYGGEMSAHHYFRDFGYCDSGMIPWLIVLLIISRTGQPLSALVDEGMRRFPASGEINRTLSDPPGALAAAEAVYGPGAHEIDHTDGVSIEHEQWRFNLRCSNTEPVVRLNVETRGQTDLLAAKTTELLELMDRYS